MINEMSIYVKLTFGGGWGWIRQKKYMNLVAPGLQNLRKKWRIPGTFWIL